MNTQFRKGVIEMCVLALIDRKDMYGYEIVPEHRLLHRDQ